VHHRPLRLGDAGLPKPAEQGPLRRWGSLHRRRSLRQQRLRARHRDGRLYGGRQRWRRRRRRRWRRGHGSGVSDAIAADATTPDGAAPDTDDPDSGDLDAAAPDAGDPDTATPDAGDPDTAAPDVGTRDTTTPDADTVAPGGPLVISELHINPWGDGLVSDADGEWIELYNPGSQARSLAGLTLTDDDGKTVVVGAGSVRPPSWWPAPRRSFARRGPRHRRGR
jgi:hypothetical protein